MAKFNVSFGQVQKGVYSKKMPAFLFAEKANANALYCTIKRIEIDFHPIAIVVKACNEIFELIDREDEFQGRIARDAWRLKTTMTLTALPFDDERLQLDSCVRSLESAVSSVPEIAKSVSSLRRTVDELMKEPTNRKREWILNKIQSTAVDVDPLAILVNLHGSTTSGWSNDICEKIGLLSQNLRFIRTSKDIADNFFSIVVVPGNPRFAPQKTLFDLLYGGRSRQVFILSYRAERVWLPAPARMPKDQLFSTGDAIPTIEKEVEVVEGTSTDQVDIWANDSFWNALRQQHDYAAPMSDRDVRVRARFVLFADGSGSFLPEDGRVVEIAAMLDSRLELDTKEDRLPRKSVADLEEGDLIMMRLSGSGDYLDEVADDLMGRAGEDDLRYRAFEWKDWLNRTIKQHGEGVMARVLRDLNVSIRSPQYLWAWAGDAVMAPHDFATFLSLIHGLNTLDPMSSDFNVSEYANAKWADMEAVKAFHQKAGSVIRTALVTRVKELIKSRQRVDVVQTIELSGVKSGKMGLLRVAAVDVKSMQIPSSRLFNLEKIVSH